MTVEVIEVVNSVTVSTQGLTGEKGDSFNIDAQGLLADLSDYDNELVGFTFYATDTGDLYIKESNTSADWSTPIAFKGDKGDKGDDGTIDLSIPNEWTGAQNFNASTLTDAINIAWDLDINQVAVLTLGGARTLLNPTNQKAGGTYILIVKQDGAGGRTLAYDTVYKFSGGIAPILSTAINAIDVLTFISDGTNMLGVAQKGFA